MPSQVSPSEQRLLGQTRGTRVEKGFETIVMKQKSAGSHCSEAAEVRDRPSSGARRGSGGCWHLTLLCGTGLGHLAFRMNIHCFKTIVICYSSHKYTPFALCVCVCTHARAYMYTRSWHWLPSLLALPCIYINVGDLLSGPPHVPGKACFPRGTASQLWAASFELYMLSVCVGMHATSEGRKKHSESILSFHLYARSGKSPGLLTHWAIAFSL